MKTIFVPSQIENQIIEKGLDIPQILTGFKVNINNETVDMEGGYLYQQVIDWFREKFGWNIQITGHRNLIYHADVWGLKNKLYDTEIHMIKGPDYYECLNSIILELLKLV